MKTLSEDFQAEVKTIRLSEKGQCSFRLEISEFSSFLDATLTVLVRIPNTDPDLGEPC